MIIPAFSVGRTQEVVYALHRPHRGGRYPQDADLCGLALSTNATEVFRLHPEYYDAETYAFMLSTGTPLGSARCATCATSRIARH